MTPLFDMRVSRADAPPNEARRSPVKGPASLSLQGTEQRTAQPETHNSQPPNEAREGVSISNQSLSDVLVPGLSLPVLGSSPVSPPPAIRPNSDGHCLSDDGLGPNQHSIASYNAPRRDSFQRSSDGSVNDDDSPRSFLKSQSFDCDSIAIASYPDRNAWLTAQCRGSPSSSITWIDHQPTGVSLLDNDTEAGAEDAQWGSNEHASLGHFRSFSEEPWNPVRGCISSLDPPAFPKLLVSPKLSVTNISDAGDQQELREEGTFQHLEDPFDEDLEQSLALLPPPGARYELQKEILDARQKTRDNEGQIKKFVSKAKLRHVITVEAVTRELKRTAVHFHPPLSSEEIRSYARMVCVETEEEGSDGKTKITSFRKIFALLVLVEAVPSIVDFVREEVTDQDLPLVKHQGFDELYRKGDRVRVPSTCFNEWSPLKLENFQSYQWWLLATYFSPPDDDGMVKNYKLQDEHILPFLNPDDALGMSTEKTGGYGKVTMVQIPPDHHSFSDTRLCKRGFAIKQQLHDENREAYKREIDILMKFSGGRSHPHIVSLLATYEQFNKFHLIFYRAAGDLFDYWTDAKPCPELDHGNVTWFAKQCSGLADGLLRLHKLLSFTKPQVKIEEEEVEDDYAVMDGISTRMEKSVRFQIAPFVDRVGTDSSILSNGVKERPTSPLRPSADFGDYSLPARGHQTHGSGNAHKKVYGRHGDINPSNILWYDDGDDDYDEDGDRTLRGTLKITDFGQAEIHSLESKTNRREVPNTLTYRPPECDLRPSVIRQTYDIWCLGCVYLEFVTWLLGGHKLLSRFGRSRRIVDYFRRYKTMDTFYEVEKDPEAPGIRAKVNPKVTAFIYELHQHPNCTPYVHEVLNLIQFDMLIVDSKDRKSCVDVWRSLDALYHRCRRNADYATMGNPWCNLWPAASSVQHYLTSASEEAIQDDQLGPRSEAPAVQPVASRRRRSSRIPRPKSNFLS